MLRVTQPQLTLWDAVLPPHLLELNDELAKVDQLLDDADVTRLFVEQFSCRMGRPTVPIDTFLRLMYLKFRYQLGFESLVQEVSDSLMWRRFCRISLDGEVPDSSTLIKLRKKYGSEIIDEANRRLLDGARKRRLIRGKKLRIDTTVVPSDVHYPTDAGLMADGVRVITRCVQALQKTDVTAGTAFRNRTRSIRKRMLAINKVTKRRTGEVWNEVRAITGEVMGVTRQVVSDAHRVLGRVRNMLRKAPEGISDSTETLAKKLNHFVALTERVITQTEKVQKGERSIPQRIVSLFDPQARPIRKGKVKTPTEFGRKVLIQETDEGIITDYQVLDGNPSDKDLLLDAVTAHTDMVGEPPKEVATDRGFYSFKAEKALVNNPKIRHVSIPKPGKLTEARRSYQRQNWFRRLQRFRAGGEARISLYKRKYGGSRCRFRDGDGTECWVGMGIMAQNLRQLTQLM